MNRFPFVILTILVFVLVACGEKEQPAVATSSAPSPATSTPSSDAGGATAGLAYDLPERWTRVQPASSMRLDQASIPGSAGPGELAVFFFGAGGGGGVEANLQRWVSQVDSAEEPTRDSFPVGNYVVTSIDISGTLQPSSMGMGSSDPQPNSRMSAAVVEGPGGPWFFKLTGPAATMEESHDEFVAMLKSVRPGS